MGVILMKPSLEPEIILNKEALESLPLFYQALAKVLQRKGKVRIANTREISGDKP